MNQYVKKNTMSLNVFKLFILKRLNKSFKGIKGRALYAFKAVTKCELQRSRTEKEPRFQGENAFKIKITYFQAIGTYTDTQKIVELYNVANK